MIEGILRFGLTAFCALLVHDWLGFEGTVIIMLAAVLFRLSVISEYLQEPASEDVKIKRLIMKNKFIRVRVRPDNIGQTVCRVNVSHLNKRGIDAEWDRLDDKYPNEKYISCLETTVDDLPCFENEPELLSHSG